MARTRNLALAAGLALFAGGAVVIATQASPDDVVSTSSPSSGSSAEAGSSPAGGQPATPPGDPVAASSASQLPVLDADPAPFDASKGTGWLNVDAPLSAADLAGKVVIYNFWTFGCSNCQATIPHVEKLYERYRDDGLVVIGIHSPEFGYEKVEASIAEHVQSEGITYPVAFDPESRIWRDFSNRYWPAFYTYDANGKRRAIHFGEGNYAGNEDVVRELLGVSPDSPRVET
jgi:thiol-disulfide isomerase/thioredoxin